MKISDFDYPLPEERIAKFPPRERDASRLLVWRDGDISESVFGDIAGELPEGSLLVFNNTRVVRARLVMHKPSIAEARGARVEVLCLEPSSPADYERAFAVRGHCEWLCMVGNLKKWKSGPIEIPFIYNGEEYKLSAWRGESSGQEQIVRFEWDADLAFGELLELLGRVPIPPYLGRDSEEVDNTRYQTVYARIEGSVAAPTAGLHFTPELIEKLKMRGTAFDEVTLHVGAGTFLPVKTDDAMAHPMHIEHFEVTLSTILHLLASIKNISFSSECTECNAAEESARECTEAYMADALPQAKAAVGVLSRKSGHIVAVGTTSVRTLESLSALGWRIRQTGSPELERPVGQFELYDIPEEFDGKAVLETLAEWMRAHETEKVTASTQIMITPAGFRFRITRGIITNFHQPRSTLLLLIAAFTGGERWREIYDYALSHDFRFLSYGDSSLLLR
jgi:S-adenosylmethionine:tRNA ribosyltransferase-isomerase